jgi:hypothetical protein
MDSSPRWRLDYLQACPDVFGGNASELLGASELVISANMGGERFAFAYSYNVAAGAVQMLRRRDKTYR